jgi:hypothetical protein
MRNIRNFVVLNRPHIQTEPAIANTSQDSVLTRSRTGGHRLG